MIYEFLKREREKEKERKREREREREIANHDRKFLFTHCPYLTLIVKISINYCNFVKLL